MRSENQACRWSSCASSACHTQRASNNISHTQATARHQSAAWYYLELLHLEAHGALQLATLAFRQVLAGTRNVRDRRLKTHCRETERARHTLSTVSYAANASATAPFAVSTDSLKYVVSASSCTCTKKLKAACGPSGAGVQGIRGFLSPPAHSQSPPAPPQTAR